jgi:hypothetical protein
VFREFRTGREESGMSSLTITTRRTASGPRFVVRYRLGGRAYPIQHAGSFRTLKEAKARRDLVAGELAAGRNPADRIRAMLAQPRLTLTVETWAERFLASRIDIDPNTTRNYRTALRRVGETFGTRDPSTITVDEVASWVADLAGKHKPWNGPALPDRVPAAARLHPGRSEPGS